MFCSFVFYYTKCQKYIILKYCLVSWSDSVSPQLWLSLLVHFLSTIWKYLLYLISENRWMPQCRNLKSFNLAYFFISRDFKSLGNDLLSLNRGILYKLNLLHPSPGNQREVFSQWRSCLHHCLEQTIKQTILERLTALLWH